MPTADRIIEGAITEIEFLPGYQFMIDRLTRDVSGVYLRPHRHRFYEMVWVTSGDGTHTIDFVQYPLVRDRVYLITPGQIHQWHENRMRGYIIQFSDSLLDKIYRELILQGADLFRTDGSEPFVALSGASVANLKGLAAVMSSEYAAESPDWDMIRPLLSAFLYELSRIGRNTRKNLRHPHYARLEKLRGLIEGNYHSQSSVGFYASALNITGKHLNDITRELLGTTVLQMVHDRITLEAKRDLSLTQDSVKEIAYRLSFDDPSYFGRFFRRDTGVSPIQFREAESQ